MPTKDSAAGAGALRGTLRPLRACAATPACASAVKRTTTMSLCNFTETLSLSPAPPPASVDRLGGGVGRLCAAGVYEDECELLFVREGGVDEGLDVVAAGRGELDVE